MFFNIFASHLGCGGINQLVHGQATLVKSPNDQYDRGKYPRNSNCRWFFPATNETEFDVAVKHMKLETCGGFRCTCDSLTIKPIAELKSKDPLYTLCEKPSKDYVVRGDMILHFKSDFSVQYTGFLVNISAWKGKEPKTFSNLIRRASQTNIQIEPRGV